MNHKYNTPWIEQLQIYANSTLHKIFQKAYSAIWKKEESIR